MDQNKQRCCYGHYVILNQQTKLNKSTSVCHQYQIAFKELSKLINCYWVALRLAKVSWLEIQYSWLLVSSKVLQHKAIQHFWFHFYYSPWCFEYKKISTQYFLTSTSLTTPKIVNIWWPLWSGIITEKFFKCLFQ